MSALAPFWRYYGGKNRATPLYPPPEHDIIVEPFAGAAGYACRYHDRRVVLVDKSPIIAGIWRYLIATPANEIMSLPDLPEGGTVDDLQVCQEARWLIGFWLNGGSVTPGRSASRWARTHGQAAHNWAGWGYRPRQRIAAQVDRIRHWRVIEGDYWDAPDANATWFVDPPYNNGAGRRYPHQPDDFDRLGRWCCDRQGLTIVCENVGANWLPFQPLADIKARRGASAEVVWINRTEWALR